MAAPGVSGGGGDDLRITWTGLDDAARLVRYHFRDFPTQSKVMTKALWVSAQPTVKAAKSLYKLGGSNSLSQATRAYRWKARKGLKHVIHIGPKRSIAAALRRWIGHYRRPIKPATFVYGIRHAHLVEFGFKHVRSKRKIPGKLVLQRAAQIGFPQASERLRENLMSVIRKEKNRLMRKRTRTSGSKRPRRAS